MAALQIKEDSATRTVLQSPLLPSLGSLGSTVVWILMLGFFFLPDLIDSRLDWTNVAIVAVVVVFLLGTSLLSSLTTTRVVVDQTTRELIHMQQILNIPLRTTVIPFRDLATLELQPYRKAEGRRARELWRVDAIVKDGRRLPLNWDGPQDAITELGRKVARRTGVQLASPSDPVPMAEPQLPRMTRELPGAEGPAPDRAQADAPARQPDTYAPPPPALPPWFMPTTGGELAPLEPAPAPATTPPPAETAAARPGESAEPRPRMPLWNMPASALEKRVESDPMDSDARYALARLNHVRNQIDRAIQLYQETLRIDSTNAEAQNDLGTALLVRGKRSEAETAYRRAIALDPFSFVAHLNLGLLLRGMNRASDASQEFYQARQSARTPAQTKTAEAASTGAKMDPLLSPH